jgi:acyl-CoA reductase-like NAD-dependent aldehyde dehydrogenase
MGERLEAGNVWVNAHAELSAVAPFGGHKESGIGCELGLEGLKSFCNIQTMYLKKMA